MSPGAGDAEPDLTLKSSSSEKSAEEDMEQWREGFPELELWDKRKRGIKRRSGGKKMNNAGLDITPSQNEREQHSNNKRKSDGFSPERVKVRNVSAG